MISEPEKISQRQSFSFLLCLVEPRGGLCRALGIPVAPLIKPGASVSHP